LILVTAFEPFGNSSLNPSQLVLQALEKNLKYSRTHKFLLLPVDYQTGPEVLLKALRSEKFQACISFGQAGGRSKISLERVAINWKEKDFNLDQSIKPGPLVINEPEAFINNEDLLALKLKLLEHNLPAEISLSAGAYVCNAVYYFAMKEKIKSLFVHLPFLPEQNQSGQPSLSFQQQRLAAEILIENFN